MAIIPKLLVIGVVVAVVAYIASFLDVEPVSHRPAPPPEFTGVLSPNDVLDSTERLFEEELAGPEAIEFYKGNMYTGLLNGTILKAENGKLSVVAYTGDPKQCAKWFTEEKCGRPLGMRFGHKDDLYVADCYMGLLRVNVSTGEVTTLFSASQPINGKLAKFSNDLDISKEGDIYFSDSSTKFFIKYALMEFTESAPNGRLLHYDPRTKTTRQLADGFHFPNGVQLSPNQDFFVFSETTRARVMKYHLTGPKKGTVETFADNLPGSPDNIRSNGRGGYWVGLCVTRLPGAFSPLEFLGPYPVVRKVITQLAYVVGRFFATVDRFIPNELSRNIAHMSLHTSTAKYIVPKYGILLELNSEGKIIRSLHAPKGKHSFVSHVTEHQGHLYLGSPWNHYVGRVKTPAN